MRPPQRQNVHRLNPMGHSILNPCSGLRDLKRHEIWFAIQVTNFQTPLYKWGVALHVICLGG